MELILWIVLPMLAAFAAQLLLCRKVKNKILRHSALLLSIPFIVLSIKAYSDSLRDTFFPGFAALAAFFWALAAAGVLFGCCAALLLSFFLRKRNEQNGEKE